MHKSHILILRSIYYCLDDFTVILFKAHILDTVVYLVLEMAICLTSFQGKHIHHWRYKINFKIICIRV